MGKRQLSSIGQQLKEIFFLIAVILQVIAVQEKELVVCGQECPVIYRNLSEYFFKIAVILQVIAVQEKEMVVCGLQLP